MVVVIVLLVTIPASAHFMWLNAEKYTTSANSEAALNIGYGHSFGNPVGNVLLERERMGEITFIDPKGGKIKVKEVNVIDYKSEVPLSKEGTYVIVAKKKEGFSSKTTSGYKQQSRKNLNNVIQCSYSGGYCKAIINVGKSGGTVFSRPVGHNLEIVPLEDPANVKQGGYLPVKVLYNGEILQTEIFATYAGFSTQGAWAYTTSSNKEGLGRIKILQPGVWMVKVSHKLPFPDPKECDQYSYTATMTFEVK